MILIIERVLRRVCLDFHVHPGKQNLSCNPQGSRGKGFELGAILIIERVLRRVCLDFRARQDNKLASYNPQGSRDKG